MKKLFLLLSLLPALAWADFGSSIDGKEASVTCTHTLACDSAWVVFGYDGDAGEVDTANMYDSLKVLPCFSGDGKTLCGDGLDLDSIGTHVVKIYYFSDDAIISIQVGIWEHIDPSAAAGLTVEEIVDGIFGENDTTIIDTSKIGTWLIRNVGTAASCFGSGARTVNIDVKNIADSTGITGFLVDVYDSSSGTFVDRQNTVNGRTTWSLDDDTWTVHLSMTRWTITTPQYLTVSGDMTQTYYATEITVTPPPAESLCVVYGYVLNKHGTGYKGAKVSMWMDVSPVTYHGSLVDVSIPTVVRTDAAGRFEFTKGMIPSGLFDQEGLKYEIRVETRQWIWADKISVPTADSWEVVIPGL